MYHILSITKVSYNIIANQTYIYANATSKGVLHFGKHNIYTQRWNIFCFEGANFEIKHLRQRLATEGEGGGTAVGHTIFIIFIIYLSYHYIYIYHMIHHIIFIILSFSLYIYQYYIYHIITEGNISVNTSSGGSINLYIVPKN